MAKKKNTEVEPEEEDQPKRKASRKTARKKLEAELENLQAERRALKSDPDAEPGSFAEVKSRIVEIEAELAEL